MQSDKPVVICPWCKVEAPARLLYTEDEDYDLDSLAADVRKHYTCSNCGREFVETRHFGNETILEGHFDDSWEANSENYTMFYGLPQDEFVEYLMAAPERCMTPSQYRAQIEKSKMSGNNEAERILAEVMSQSGTSPGDEAERILAEVMASEKSYGLRDTKRRKTKPLSKSRVSLFPRRSKASKV